MFLAIFIVGVFLVVMGVLLVCFPRALDELSNITSQAIINIESKVTKRRLPFGILVFLLGAVLMWIAQAKKF